MDKRIPIGSQVFFTQYEDFEPLDRDFVEFQDNPTDYHRFKAVRKNGEEVFYYKTMPKEEFIEAELKHCRGFSMVAGKFLVPELVEFIGLTIDDLKLFERAFTHMDEKHKYEELIYAYYIENNDFSLTDEQRDKVYQLYKEKRNFK